MSTAAAAWETLDSEAALSGVDLLELPAVRLCNIVYARVRAAAKDDDEWRKTLTMLTRPLDGRKPTTALRDFRRDHMPRGNG